SPILDRTREQAAALEGALGSGFSVHVAMRYWPPFAAQAVEEALAAGARRIVALPLYPHRSRTTSVSSVKALRRAVARRAPWMPVHEVCSFPEAEGFRSEERRVGKECRSRWSARYTKKKREECEA